MSKSSVIGDVFNEISADYDSVMDQMVPHYRKLITSVFEYLPKGLKPDRILDLGCGNGNPSLVATALYPLAKMHLVDASQEMLTLCRARLGTGDYEFTQELFQDLSLDPGSYDLAYGCFSLHHLEGNEKQDFFRKVFSALRPGGVFACADLLIDKNEEFHKTHLVQWRAFIESQGRTAEDWDWLIEHYTAYDRPNSFADQEEWLRSAGFEEVRLSWNDGQWGCFHALKA